MDAETILERLRSMANPANVAGMARFGISSHHTLGISVPSLRDVARDIRKVRPRKPGRHALAAELWASGGHEARGLATMIEIPELVTPEQMDAWVAGVDSWDICNGLCMGLFDRTAFAKEKAQKWAQRKEEFVPRAGFALMAALAFKRHRLADEEYEPFFALMTRYATDERNFVRKAVNWALRQTGKRNERLLVRAIDVAREIEAMDSRSARWIAKDALRELLKRQQM